MNPVLFKVIMLLSCDFATYNELYVLAQYHETTIEKLIEIEMRKSIGKLLVYCDVKKETAINVAK